MMPYCDFDKCKNVADRIFATTEDYVQVALCTKHNPESSRAVRRKKAPSETRFTKKLFKRRKFAK